METLKILLVGNSNSGKSSILLRYTENSFTDESITTIGVDFKLKMVKYEDKTAEQDTLKPEDTTYKLCMFDTAGQERFSKLTSSYYRNAQGVLLVFDLSNRETFDSLNKWYNELQAYCPNAAIVVVGNKSDESRQVTRKEASQYADAIGGKYVEVSAKSNINVEDAFQLLLKDIINHPTLLKKVKRSPSLRSVRSIQFNHPTESSYCNC